MIKMIREAKREVRDVIDKRRIIMQMAKKEFTSQYVGSYLGIVWSIINPLVMVAIYWFVFSVGFKTVPMDEFPFLVWLLAGIIPWFYFSETLGSNTSTVIQNSYLVKKVIFNVSLLPIIRIISSSFVHIFFICVTVVILSAYGYYPNLYYLQVVYYYVAMIMLLLGLSWITSALAVFMKDVISLVGVFLQFGFWLTPIFWPFSIVPEKFQMLLKLNPIYYIVEGYRETFLYGKWFWESPALTLYFWCFTLVIFLTGFVIFKKLRPHFADVL